MKGLNKEKSERFNNSKIIWLATTSRNFIPHLVPIWFITHDEKIYCCTGRESVKTRNILINPMVAFSLEEGTSPIIGQGSSKIIDPPYLLEIVEKFKKKYDWDIRNDETYDCVLEISPAKWMMNG